MSPNARLHIALPYFLEALDFNHRRVNADAASHLIGDAQEVYV